MLHVKVFCLEDLFLGMIMCIKARNIIKIHYKMDFMRATPRHLISANNLN